MNSLILKNGIVIDGTGKKESQGKTILIQNTRIQIEENPDNLNNFPPGVCSGSKLFREIYSSRADRRPCTYVFEHSF